MTTKQQTGHTPLPWRIGGRNDYQIAAGDEVDIARAMSKALNVYTLEERRITHEERAANAELIVRAVNAHDDLVAACESLLADPEDIVIRYERDPDGYPEGLANLMVTLDQLDALRAAFAKARQ